MSPGPTDPEIDFARALKQISETVLKRLQAFYPPGLSERELRLRRVAFAGQQYVTAVEQGMPDSFIADCAKRLEARAREYVALIGEESDG